MHSLLISGGSSDDAPAFERRPLGDGDGFDEKWLQELLFKRPDLLPLEEIDPAALPFVPICRELALPRASGGPVYLDIFGVTPTGRLVLVECKLWRNPQARREVIGQILEYAALLRQWSYSDLEAQLKRQLGWTGVNPLFHHVRSKHQDLQESAFGDGVARSLAYGDFTLVVAGDGIRSDIQSVVRLLDARGGLLARLGLAEIQLWQAADGRLLVVPTVPLRTELVRHRVIVAQTGHPLPLAEPEESDDAVAEVSSAGSEVRNRNRAFWQRFIDEVEFDYPDQPKPRHGGNNYVRLDLPHPASPMVIYRSQGEKAVGVFVEFRSDEGRAAFESLRSDRDQIARDVSLALEWDTEDARLSATQSMDVLLPETVDQQLVWLKRASNALVSALRPRLAAFSRSD